MFAWNFHFPLATELILWRVGSIYTLIYTFVGCISTQYCHKVLFPRWSKLRPALPMAERNSFAARLRNMHPSKDPRLDIPLRALLSVSVLCALYCASRLYTRRGLH
ncbi:hypothetical protein BDV59DRAFT_159747 [Aspergillus ambiguus]|uniref:uncharacterized protein n=1 Tax=Aspergillus ambiguus TaxID=176160 RepID=UPI003CCCC3CA